MENETKMERLKYNSCYPAFPILKIKFLECINIPGSEPLEANAGGHKYSCPSRWESDYQSFVEFYTKLCEINGGEFTEEATPTGRKFTYVYNLPAANALITATVLAECIPE